MNESPQHVRLHFDEAPRVADRMRNISAAVRLGPTLWIGSDEGVAVQRLVHKGDSGFHQAGSFSLAEFFDLPDGGAGHEARRAHGRVRLAGRADRRG